MQTQLELSGCANHESALRKISTKASRQALKKATQPASQNYG